ncbi:replication-associated recombination protein A [Haploplasma axanthum]|uniref:ATPase n=1 Tax=Haploplasma axanthum TaxID=29552 RepID=A0A449BEE7_HAPAX|nr:replication-associated recombination protein A [Haploplasma axanthum]VEU80806.1 ATPase [Haploplasma axanthum]
MQQPLAYLMRPKTFDDVLGQEHLIGKDGILSAMIKKQKPLSFILYGPPGTGKTTIANIFAESFDMETYFFNASTDNKARLMDILNTTNFTNILLIIDEIHRMKTDVQDYLLPFVESGKATFIGLTTLNPYHSINWAIRSRCHLYEVKKLNDDDIKKAIQKGLHMLDIDIKIEPNALDSLVRYSNHEIRSALNLLESVSLVLKDGDTLTNSLLLRIAGNPKYSLDKSDDNYYQLLSALQKSIRGSDVDASLHYLARLLVLEDLNSLTRRLLVITYEDIGLANPNIAPKVLAACEAAKMVGMPEARIIFSNIVIELAISPKSNSAYLAIAAALDDYSNNDTGEIPNHVDNNKIKLDPSIYHYPHDDNGSLNDQIYLPDKIKEKTYYLPKEETKYEAALKVRLDLIDKIKGKKR